MGRPSTDTINLNFFFCPPTDFFVVGFCCGEVFSYIHVYGK